MRAIATETELFLAHKDEDMKDLLPADWCREDQMKDMTHEQG